MEIAVLLSCTLLAGKLDFWSARDELDVPPEHYFVQRILLSLGGAAQLLVLFLRVGQGVRAVREVGR